MTSCVEAEDKQWHGKSTPIVSCSLSSIVICVAKDALDSLSTPRFLLPCAFVSVYVIGFEDKVRIKKRFTGFGYGLKVKNVFNYMNMDGR